MVKGKTLKGLLGNGKPLCPQLSFFLLKAVNIFSRTWKSTLLSVVLQVKGQEALEKQGREKKAKFPPGQKRLSIHREGPLPVAQS